MIEHTLTIANKHGLHARPAAEFVKLSGRFEADVKLTKDGFTVDGKSIMGVLMLGAGKGSVLTLAVNGPDEEEAFDVLKSFLESDTDEELL